MNSISQQKGFLDTALTIAFAPVILGFLVGALPVLLPLLATRGFNRLRGAA